MIDPNQLLNAHTTSEGQKVKQVRRHRQGRASTYYAAKAALDSKRRKYLDQYMKQSSTEGKGGLTKPKTKFDQSSNSQQRSTQKETSLFGWQVIPKVEQFEQLNY